MKGLLSVLVVSLSFCFAWANDSDCSTYQPSENPTKIRIKSEIPLNPDPEVAGSYYLYQTVGQSMCQSTPIGACTVTANEFGSASIETGTYDISDAKVIHPDTLNKNYRVKIVVETEKSVVLKQVGGLQKVTSELSFFCAFEKFEDVTPANINLLLFEMAELQ